MSPPDELIRAAVAGDTGAWSQLVADLAPRVQRFAAAHPVMRKHGLASRPDSLSEVTTACIERLARNHMRNLSLYLERPRPLTGGAQSFDSWLYGAVDFAIRDHLRARFGRAPMRVERSSERNLPSKHDFGSGAQQFDDAQMARLVTRARGVTTHLTFVEILEYVRATFEPGELLAWRMHYFEDRTLDEIARELELSDAAEADRLLRKLKARLRSRFAATECAE